MGQSSSSPASSLSEPLLPVLQRSESRYLRMQHDHVSDRKSADAGFTGDFSILGMMVDPVEVVVANNMVCALGM